MIQAIVYTSNAGTTKQYAELFGSKTGLPVYSLEDATKKLQKGACVIYFGWLMASKVKGYSKAQKRFEIAAVGGVCMGETGSQLDEVRKSNHIPAELPVFTMQGGFDITKLHGIYKFMMTAMVKTAGKGLADKKDRTPDEDKMLDMMLHGGNYVSVENMKELLAWYEAQK